MCIPKIPCFPSKQHFSGNITSGLPPFQLPQFSTEFNNQTYTFPQMVNEIKLGVFILPLVAVLANVTIAKAFCKFWTILSLCDFLYSIFNFSHTRIRLIIQNGS